jgi:RNA polymerase sigma-70 factor, ECF subfamily
LSLTAPTFGRTHGDVTASLQRVDIRPGAPDDDIACLERIRAGDAVAFEELFRRYAEPLYDCAHGYVGSRDAAQEIVQQVFVNVWERRCEWDVSHTVATYLFRAVRNGSLNALRDRRRGLAFRARLSDTVTRTAPDIAQEIEAAELAVAVARVVARLPARCREVFRLNRYHHLTYAEVAEVLGLSVKTVEVHMARALRELRTRLRV